MQEIVDSGAVLLDNTGVNGVNLAMDGGWLLNEGGGRDQYS